jgi:DNA repair exonuclease SbcCD nuclease subunit
VFISPGNHDPYLKNSYYSEFEFAPNVYIFKGALECKELPDCNIYGMGFTSFYCKDVNFGNLTVIENGKPNILVMHASLDGGAEKNKEYNPVLESKLLGLNMDYIALGHIHKPYYNEKKNQNIVYPGSLISFGFDELGHHGMIVGEIENRNLELQFLKLDDTEFAKIEQNVEKFNSRDDLIEFLNGLDIDENKFYEIELVGNRNFEINVRDIFKLITKYNILKIKDLTRIGYDLNEIEKEHSIKGLFVKEALKKLEDEKYTKEEIEKAIEIGLNSMKE